ncbi:MAG: formimidoylglutamate deiminase [Bacteroidetes bacterium]|nr:formimidoylglutamate deiminase [Bacteroidota bacterium]
MNNKVFRFNGLYSTGKWIEPAFVEIDAQGTICAIAATKPMEKQIEWVDGYALPGFVNAHSHAFQYAMAGTAERAAQGTNDDFWTWRNAMYQVALQVNPEQLEAIATMLYAEMLRHGFTHVAEFHYLHHDPAGKPYAHLAEMGERLVRAAQAAGIHITLIPIFYKNGGFGQVPGHDQRRFLCETSERYLQLLDASRRVVSAYHGAKLGFGLHSLRAVDPQAALETLPFAASLPIHMHIAEQIREVEEAQAFLGARPVEWLLHNMPVSSQWHLVHATHMTHEETAALARSGAQVVLCPSTEGNLGDGIFPLLEYMAAGGSWSIGTDSQIGLDPKGEFRLLDYGQRLKRQRRDTFRVPAHDWGYTQAFAAGARAMGLHQVVGFDIGAPLDAVVLDANYPLWSVFQPEHLLPKYLFAADATANLGTLVAGKWVVRNNVHLGAEGIKAAFRKAMTKFVE